MDIARTLEILEKLVGFDTTSNLSNISLIHWVRDYLLEHDVNSTLIPDKTGKKMSLIACIGEATQQGVVLSGHTDVVPAQADQWSNNPYKLIQRDDRVYGRGTTDMKGFLSNVLAAVPHMKRTKLNRPITIAFSYDEEVGCLGTPDIVAALPPEQYVIVGEPTLLKAGVRHKGARVQSVIIEGIPAHSGTPSFGVNAIAYGHSVLGDLIACGQEFLTAKSGYQSNLVVTSILGGGAVNIIPAKCEISWMFRPAQDMDAAQFEKKINQIVSDLDAKLKGEHLNAGVRLHTSCDVPLFVRESNGLMSEFDDKILSSKDTIDLDFATEAGIFQNAGHNVIVCGPGDMKQGHTDDEFIEMSELVAGQVFVERVINAATA